MTFYIVFIILILQRLMELKITKKNLILNEGNLFHPIHQKEKNQMLLLHILWFFSCFIEFYFLGNQISSPYFWSLIGFLILLQGIRFSIIHSLGTYWTTYPVAFKNQKIVTNGLFKYIKHPNYLIVMLEIFLYPLLGQCYYTSIIFGIINMFFIVRRINLEENELNHLAEYRKEFSMKKKLIPFLFSLILIFSAQARVIKIDSKDFTESKNAKTYFKFTGESTKFGLVTTSFEGVAKQFSLNFTEKKDKLENIELLLPVKAIDTDNNSRNEKMWDLCLEEKKYPEIKVNLPKIDLTATEQTSVGEMTIKDKKIPLEFVIKKVSEKIYQGKTSFKLSKANIPDPSIAIASVKDEFLIQFQVDLAE